MMSRTPPRWRCIAIVVCSLGIIAPPLLGESKLLVREGIPIVNGVFVNGHGPYRFLLDTGANVNLMETQLAKSIGIQPTLQNELSSASGSAAVSGADGLVVELDALKADRQLFMF